MILYSKNNNMRVNTLNGTKTLYLIIKWYHYFNLYLFGTKTSILVAPESSKNTIRPNLMTCQLEIPRQQPYRMTRQQ